VALDNTKTIGLYLKYLSKDKRVSLLDILARKVLQQQARVFVPEKHFQPSLMFVCKLGAYPSGASKPEPQIFKKACKKNSLA
jgi:hypothetical protein